jgi:integrase
MFVGVKRTGKYDYLQLVGIRDRIGTHSLRKTWGYQARKSGVPLELIQAKLGHSSPGVTRRYIGITADEIESMENRVTL